MCQRGFNNGMCINIRLMFVFYLYCFSCMAVTYKIKKSIRLAQILFKAVVYTTLENVFLNNHDLNHSETYILGDFNTDVPLCSTGVLQSSLKSFMHMFNFKQLIQDFTIISNASSSVIDLILVSDCDKVVQSGVLKTSFSDHFAIYCTRKISRPSIGTHMLLNCVH